jgi:hypothetical protein
VLKKGKGERENRKLESSYMQRTFNVLLVILFLPICGLAQSEEDWPPTSYLRNDYKAVKIVAHVRILESEITGRIGGYENWRIRCEVLEPFKGRFKKGNIIEYFHGAEAPSKKEFFTGEKLVFLLADKENRAWRYSVLENSTLSPNENRLKKLRSIKASYAKRR